MCRECGVDGEVHDVYPDFFYDFWDDAGKWSTETFGPRSLRGPQGPLEHLKKEIEEIISSPGDIEEYVDAYFLILDAARRAGFTSSEFEMEVWKKLEKNKQRKWPDWRTADLSKPIEHFREPPLEALLD